MKLGLWYSCAKFDCLGDNSGLKMQNSLAQMIHRQLKKVAVKLKVDDCARMSSEADVSNLAASGNSLVDKDHQSTDFGVADLMAVKTR